MYCAVKFDCILAYSQQCFTEFADYGFVARADDDKVVQNNENLSPEAIEADKARLIREAGIAIQNDTLTRSGKGKDGTEYKMNEERCECKKDMIGLGSRPVTMLIQKVAATTLFDRLTSLGFSFD